MFERILKFFQSFRGNSSKKFDFGHRSGALARPGSRELRAVKIPASYDAWRPSKRRKNGSEKIRFFWSQKSVFRHFSWILEDLDNFRHQNQLPREILLQICRFSVPRTSGRHPLDIRQMSAASPLDIRLSKKCSAENTFVLKNPGRKTNIPQKFDRTNF